MEVNPSTCIEENPAKLAEDRERLQTILPYDSIQFPKGAEWSKEQWRAYLGAAGSEFDPLYAEAPESSRYMENLLEDLKITMKHDDQIRATGIVDRILPGYTHIQIFRCRITSKTLHEHNINPDNYAVEMEDIRTAVATILTPSSDHKLSLVKFCISESIDPQRPDILDGSIIVLSEAAAEDKYMVRQQSPVDREFKCFTDKWCKLSGSWGKSGLGCQNFSIETITEFATECKTWSNSSASLKVMSRQKAYKLYHTMVRGHIIGAVRDSNSKLGVVATPVGEILDLLVAIIGSRTDAPSKSGLRYQYDKYKTRAKAEELNMLKEENDFVEAEGDEDEMMAITPDKSKSPNELTRKRHRPISECTVGDTDPGTEDLVTPKEPKKKKKTKPSESKKRAKK